MKVDMSSDAVTARLKRVSQLRRLCLALGKSRPAARTPASSDSIPNVKPQLDDSLTTQVIFSAGTSRNDKSE